MDKTIYKNLDIVKTYENNISWYNKVVKIHKKNKKWDFNFCNEEISEVIKRKELNNFYDLIFVDDSNSAILRSASIKVALQIKNRFLIVHDYEPKDYKRALSECHNICIIDSLTPQTALIYNNKDADLIKETKDIITFHSNTLEMNDYKNWLKGFQNES